MNTTGTEQPRLTFTQGVLLQRQQKENSDLANLVITTVQNRVVGLQREATPLGTLGDLHPYDDHQVEALAAPISVPPWLLGALHRRDDVREFNVHGETIRGPGANTILLGHRRALRAGIDVGLGKLASSFGPGRCRLDERAITPEGFPSLVARVCGTNIHLSMVGRFYPQLQRDQSL